MSEQGEGLLLPQSPVAGELRYALAITRIVPERERSGDERLADHAVHIATRVANAVA